MKRHLILLILLLSLILGTSSAKFAIANSDTLIVEGLPDSKDSVEIDRVNDKLVSNTNKNTGYALEALSENNDRSIYDNGGSLKSNEVSERVSLTLNAGEYVYENETMAGIGLGGISHAKMWVQTDELSDTVDLNILSSSSFEAWKSGGLHSIINSANDVHVTSLEYTSTSPSFEQIYFIWYNDKSTSIGLDLIYDNDNSYFPSFSGHTFQGNDLTLEPKKANSVSDSEITSGDMVQGYFENYMTTDCLDFYIFDTLSFTSFVSTGIATDSKETIICASAANWGPFIPPYASTWYFVFSSQNADDTITYSHYIDQSPVTPTISIIEPTSTDEWPRGSQAKILWNSLVVSDEVKIELYQLSTFVTTIVSSTPNDGEYLWDIPLDTAIGTDYIIKISVTTDSTVFDTSESFTIESEPKSINVFNPTSGEKFDPGDTVSITWTWTGTFSTVDIEIYRGKLIYTSIINQDNTGSFDWSIPSDIDYGTIWSVKIIDTSNPLVSENSAYFTILGNNPPPIGNGDDGSLKPKIKGFNFPLEIGVYWAYKWDLHKYDLSTTTNTYGEFDVVLVATKEIGGITAYKIEIQGDSGTTSFVNIRWTYLAVFKHQILGSYGFGWSVIFDGITGNWQGGGFFTSMPTDASMTATSGSLSNNYNYASGYKISHSVKEGGCEIIAGIRFCDDYEMKSDVKELYKGGIGPISYSYYKFYSSSSGGYYSMSEYTGNLGLVDSLIPSELPIPPYSSSSAGNSASSSTSSNPTSLATTQENGQKSNGRATSSNTEETPIFVGYGILIFNIIAVNFWQKRKK